VGLLVARSILSLALRTTREQASVAV
jgi:hypothetical protein